jgi:hypothetical protein
MIMIGVVKMIRMVMIEEIMNAILASPKRKRSTPSLAKTSCSPPTPHDHAGGINSSAASAHAC